MRNILNKQWKRNRKKQDKTFPIVICMRLRNGSVSFYLRHISTKLQQMLKRETIIRPTSINSINLNKSTNIMDHYVLLFETGMIVWRQHRAIKYKQGWKY